MLVETLEIKKNQTECKIKSTISEMKNMLDGIKSRFDITEEKSMNLQT